MERKRREVRDILRRILGLVMQQIEEGALNQLNRPKRLWDRNRINGIKFRTILDSNTSYTNTTLEESVVEDQKEYRESMRMTDESFDWLLNKVRPAIEKSNTPMRSAISARTKLQAVLYMMATGNSSRSISQLFKMSQASLSLMIPDVCHAICNTLQDYINAPRNEYDWKAVEQQFRKSFHFPNCCGAIDGKYVVIKAPFKAGSTFFNYKQQNSIALIAIVDDDYCFKYIDVCSNNRISEGGVFQNCSISSSLEAGLLPEKHILVGDAAFPLKTYLMTPYGDESLTEREKIFNYRLSRARNVIDNAFGVLVSRFRIFERPLPYAPSTVEKIVRACCALHNWLNMTKSPIITATLDLEDTDTGKIVPGNWRRVPSEGLVPIPRHSQNNLSKEAHQIREQYANYFSEDGAMAWQPQMIDI